MVVNPLYLLILALVPVLAIVVFDWLRHGLHGWWYYALAFLMVLAFQLVYMVVTMAIAVVTVTRVNEN